VEEVKKLEAPWLIPLSSGWRRRASTRKLQSAELVTRSGIAFIDCRLPHSNATRFYAAGARVQIKSGAVAYVGTIETVRGRALRRIRELLDERRAEMAATAGS